jgi:Protein of unknown function (DUF3179)
VWETTVDGRQLHFHLAGINNQNFIMRDEETGSWWQQVTGLAILGPLKGKKLKQVFHDELTFALWKKEQPKGRVLRPDEGIERAGKYAPADWEQRMTKVQVTTSAALDTALKPRELIAGVSMSGESKAYPIDALIKQRLILDDIRGHAIFLVMGDDDRSVRGFERTVDGQKLEFFVKPNSKPLVLVDQSGTEWDFTGKAISGPLAGKELGKVMVYYDYWFDWQAYNPKTFIYNLGNR